MRLIFDADALIKLTKAGAKEVVTSAYDVWIPLAVHHETVTEGKAGAYPDALQIEANIAEGRIHLVSAAQLAEGPEVEVLSGGERDVAAAWHGGPFDAIVSDDQKFLRLLAVFGRPFMTPGVLIVHLMQRQQLPLSRARALLEALRPWISADEYSVCLLALQEGRV